MLTGHADLGPVSAYSSCLSCSSEPQGLLSHCTSWSFLFVPYSNRWHLPQLSHLGAVRNYQLSLFWYSGTINILSTEAVILFASTFLPHLPEKNNLTLLWKSTPSTILGLGFLEKRQCKCLDFLGTSPAECCHTLWEEVRHST